VLLDGTELHVDIVMYATGYEFNMPFLDKEDNIVEIERERSGGRFVYPMYKKMVAIREPNFNIVGLLTGSPIPLAGVDRQIMFSLCLLNGWVKLPSKKAMLEECHNEIDFTTLTLKKSLDKVFRYASIICDSMSQLSKIIVITACLFSSIFQIVFLIRTTYQ
jgi:hypothetical protein